MRVRARRPDPIVAPATFAPGPEEALEQSQRAGVVRSALATLSDGARRLPIRIGPPDGDALAARLAEQQTPRPLAVDLTAGLLAAAGAEVERVTVNRLAERTFYAVVTLANAGEVDARPSDALDLALRVGAPVYVADDVLDRAATVADDVAAELDDREQELGYERGAPWRELDGREVGAARHAQRPK
jgi:bifunctional DNase/RNase